MPKCMTPSYSILLTDIREVGLVHSTLGVKFTARGLSLDYPFPFFYFKMTTSQSLAQ